jgi:hypothetical protein
MDKKMVRREKKKRREEEMGSSGKQGRIVLAVINKRLLLGDAGLHPHMHGTQQLCLITGKQLDELSHCVCLWISFLDLRASPPPPAKAS